MAAEMAKIVPAMRTIGKMIFNRYAVAFTAIQISCLAALHSTTAQERSIACMPSNTGDCLAETGEMFGEAVPAISPVSASFTPIENPDAAYTAATARIDISEISDFTTLTSVGDAVLTVAFSTVMQKRRVAPGGGWATWSSPPFAEDPAPHVLFSQRATSATLALSHPVQTFGFELEPNYFGSFSYTVTFFSGSSLIGSIERTLKGRSGARLFAGSMEKAVIDRVVITGERTGRPPTFAIAQLRYGGAQLSGPLLCGGRLATIVGTDANDLLIGLDDDDVIVGLGGNDGIRGGGGNDTICGGPGDDVIEGGGGRDVLIGQSGNDILDGGPGADQLIGDKGNDTLLGRSGPDELYGGTGDDTMDGGTETDFCVGATEVSGDTAINCEAVQGVP